MKCLKDFVSHLRPQKDIDTFFLIDDDWRKYLSESSKLDFYITETTKFLDNLQDSNAVLSNRLSQIIGWNIVFITALIGLLFKENLSVLLKHFLTPTILFLIIICFINLFGIIPYKTKAKGIFPQEMFKKETLEYIQQWYKNYNKDIQQSLFLLESYNVTARKLLLQNARKAVRIRIAIITLMFSILLLATIVSFI